MTIKTLHRLSQPPSSVKTRPGDRFPFQDKAQQTTVNTTTYTGSYIGCHPQYVPVGANQGAYMTGDRASLGTEGWKLSPLPLNKVHTTVDILLMTASFSLRDGLPASLTKTNDSNNITTGSHVCRHTNKFYYMNRV